MSLFVMGDTHLSLGADKPMDIFGPRWQNYTEKIKSAWLNEITDKDTVVIPGDISWGMNTEETKADFQFLESLPGTKIILKGNHDFWWSTLKKAESFFEENGIRSVKILHNNAYLCEGRLICGSRGWFCDDKNAPEGTCRDKLVNREVGRLQMSFDKGRELSAEAEILCFLHFPPVFHGYKTKEITDVLKKNGVRRCWFGHIHSSYDEEPSIEYDGIEFHLASADYLNFKPLKIL